MLLEISTFPQAIKLTFERNKFGKGQCTIYRLEYSFRKKSRNQVDKIIDQLYLSKTSRM